MEHAMPLITCPDCQKSISDAAPYCIHCGRPEPAAASHQQMPLNDLKASDTHARLCYGCDALNQPTSRSCFNCDSPIGLQPPQPLEDLVRSSSNQRHEGERFSASTASMIAGIASFFVPGLGQLLQGRLGAAIGF